MSTVLLEKKNGVGLITINRPDAMNALNTQVLSDLRSMLACATNDDEIGALVITGAGRAFVAGADIAEMKDLNPIEAKRFGVHGNQVFMAIEQMGKPVIAAINGFALGGGCELALACDIRVASEKAKFGQPETTLGITPGFGGTQRLPRTVGMAKAKELIFTGRVIDANEAQRIGLVSYVLPPEELMDFAMTMAKDMADNSRIAIAQCKTAMEKGMDCDISAAVAMESEAFGVCFATEDQKGAMTAFVNREKYTQYKNK